MQRFEDRYVAGERLGRALGAYAQRDDLLVLALPRGGVPVGFEVARTLGAPLDVLVARKLGVPGHEELAMGAIAGGGVQVLNQDVVGMLHIDQQVIDSVAAREREELHRRERLYRGEAPQPMITDHTVILVDDGVATGATMIAAIRSLRTSRPRQVVVAVPVASPEAVAALQAEADHVVTIGTPDPFDSVGRWYRNFRQTSDAEVRAILAMARWQVHAHSGP